MGAGHGCTPHPVDGGWRAESPGAALGREVRSRVRCCMTAKRQGAPAAPLLRTLRTGNATCLEPARQAPPRSPAPLGVLRRFTWRPERPF